MRDEIEELVRLEHARCEAISSGDIEKLGDMLANDLSHTHITGKSEDKPTYLAALRGRPRTTTRGDDLRVRLYGNVAVMTGTLRNSFPSEEPGGRPRDSEIQALQVWVKGDQGWQQVAFASSGTPPRTE
jgi:ketosteroid isomerase-like protein